METQAARWRRAAKGVLGALGAALVFLGVSEVLLSAVYAFRNSAVPYVPLPYVIGQDYGPIPPWLDSQLMLTRDEALLWRNRPNLRTRYLNMFSPARSVEDRIAVLRRFWPPRSGSDGGDAYWEISLNGEGFRNGAFPQTKSPSAFRIVCLGDSWTFGMGVDQDQAYPQRLVSRLQEKFPKARFEVLNLGVLGYSSYQGLVLLKASALDLNPDVVILGFGMNDSKITGVRDTDMAASLKRPELGERIDRVLETSKLYKLLKYAVFVRRHRPGSVGDYLKKEADDAAAESKVDYAKFEPWTRVSPAAYERNVRDMVRLSRARGSGVLLLYNEFWEGNVIILQRVSREERVPLVDGSALIRTARARIAADLEQALNLRPSPDTRSSDGQEIEAVFRVYMATTPVPKAVYLTGTHSRLGALVPNKLAMFDDGTHGDQRAGDSVWSYAARLPAGTLLFYVYTNSGVEGKWEGLDVPHIREVSVGASRGAGRIYLPIDTFGKVYMQADSWHPDAPGYDLIARAAAGELANSDSLRAYLQRTGALGR